MPKKKRLEVCPLFAALPQEQQLHAFRSVADPSTTRKVSERAESSVLSCTFGIGVNMGGTRADGLNEQSVLPKHHAVMYVDDRTNVIHQSHESHARTRQ